MISTVETFAPQTDGEEVNIAQVSNFLRHHEEVELIIPVLFGVYVTSQLQLRGLNALLVNLAVASIFRSIFKQIKNSNSIYTSENTDQKKTSVPNPPTDILGEGVTIVHSVPGRIRLRIEQLHDDVAFGKRLLRLLENEDCVINARINRTACCLVINYDAQGLSDLDLGFKLMNILNNAKNEDLNPDVTFVDG